MSDLKPTGSPFQVDAYEGQLSISGSEDAKIRKVAIYSTDGRLLMAKQFDAVNNVQINCSRLPAQIYLVVLNDQFSEKLFLK